MVSKLPEKARERIAELIADCDDFNPNDAEKKIT